MTMEFVYFSFLFLYSKEKKLKSKTFFYKICCIIKINVANSCFCFLIRTGYYEQNINYMWPKGLREKSTNILERDKALMGL